MNTPVNFELAKLLKKKGFNEPCATVVAKGNKYSLVSSVEHTVINGMVFTTTKNQSLPDNFASAPTIAEVVMWLCEKHGIWVVANIDIQNRWYFELFNLKNKRNAEILPNDEYWFNSPTEAYEAAIQYCLTNLL